jgi:hypothetical protein
VVAALVAALVLVGGGLAPRAAAATPDPSNVVLVLDFSASILDDAANRNRFAAALRRIADRVDATSADLVAGDATVSIVQFATRAADYPYCSDLRLLDNPTKVGKFADCLRSVANAYRRGLTPALTRKIGVDTNYVAAMEQAARHLPADAVRPAVILFTDGKHDVAGVPLGRVQPASDRLFGARSPFAFLPVGMGLAAAGRAALASGLERLRVIRDMPACVSGATFDWPQVVFQSAEDAGNAVAVALQDATCTFTAAPTPSPTPTPTPAPTPAAVQGIRLTPGDGRIEVVWSPVAPAPADASPIPIVDYTVRCRAGEGPWIESTEGVSIQPHATVEGLTNGTEYACEVAAVDSQVAGPWAPAIGLARPIGRPAPPAKPSVEALNGAIRIGVAATEQPGLATYHYECSSDNGATWSANADVAADAPSASIANLTNGVSYVCRAFAKNTTGVSEASPVSDAVRPCASFLDCNSLFAPLLGGLGLLLVGGLLAAFFALFRGRTTGYVIAVVDVVHTANIGHGSKLGISFVRDENARRVSGIVAERGGQADVRIRRLRGGRFAVTDKTGRTVVEDGDPVVVVDSKGIRHSLVLRAFATNAASSVASRR